MYGRGRGEHGLRMGGCIKKTELGGPGHNGNMTREVSRRFSDFFCEFGIG